jgi:mono/diheme cytochrome c family protein
VKRLLLPALLLSCSGTSVPPQPGRDYVRDMIDAQAVESFSESSVSRDGKAMRAPAPGSLPRGYQPFDYAATREDATRAGLELKNPLSATPAEIEAGNKVFHTVCFTCHGNEGKGDGPVVPRFPQPPSLTAAHARTLPDGQIFHIVTRGQGLMPAHPQVPPVDRWRAALYIRSLQKGSP